MPFNAPYGPAIVQEVEDPSGQLIDALIDGHSCGRVQEGGFPIQYFFRVIVPAAMPAIMTALRAASSICWTLVVAPELLVAQAGLGFIILDPAQYFTIPATFTGIVLIGAIGLA